MNLGLVTLALALSSVSMASASETKECSNAPLMRALSVHRGAGGIEITQTPDQVSLTPPALKAKAIEVTCDNIWINPDLLPARPENGKLATVRSFEWGVLSRTSGEAISIDFQPGALHRNPLSLLVLDDGSHTLTRDGEILYSIGTDQEGTLVVREGWGLGCGCERRIAPDGTTSVKALPRLKLKR